MHFNFNLCFVLLFINLKNCEKFVTLVPRPSCLQFGAKVDFARGGFTYLGLGGGCGSLGGGCVSLGDGWASLGGGCASLGDGCASLGGVGVDLDL